MRSVVRLFCFLTRMVFQQPPPFLIHVPNYLFLLLVMVKGYVRKIARGVKGYVRKIAGESEGLCAWKTLRNHTSLWK